MSLKSDPQVLRRVERSIDRWLRRDGKRLGESFGENAALASPFAPSEPDAESSWIQGRDEVCEHLDLIRESFPLLKKIDVFLGTNFVVILMGDGTNKLSVHVEPDDQGVVQRLIICRSSSLPVACLQRKAPLQRRVAAR